MNNMVIVNLDLSFLEDDSVFNEYLNCIKPYRLKKINKLNNKEDKIRSLGAELAIKKAFELFGLYYKDEEILIDENGKPYLKSNHAYFNYSHSNNRALCVVSSSRVGCDIELIKNNKEEIASRFFTINEFNNIKCSGSNDAFYKIWTLKESFIKCIGLGLKIPLNSFEINVNNDDIKINQKINKNEYKFLSYMVDGYELAICLENPQFDLKNAKVINL